MAESETPLPLTITMAALPVGFEGTPQELADAIAERLEITSQQVFALISQGATEPTSNIGPWAKNGNQWEYWNDESGEYAPFIIPQESLQFQISVSEPTLSGINIWYQIDSNGDPVAIKFRKVDGGSVTWESPYYLKTEVYTQAETDTAIVSQNRYGVRAKPNATQNFDVDAANHKLTFDGTIVDENSRFDAGNYRYTALVKGLYQVNALVRLDDVSSTPAGMQATLKVMSGGGVTTEGEVCNNTPSPNGSFWDIRIADSIVMNAGGYIELFANCEDGVNTGAVQLNPTISHWEVSLIQTLT